MDIQSRKKRKKSKTAKSESEETKTSLDDTNTTATVMDTGIIDTTPETTTHVTDDEDYISLPASKEDTKAKKKHKKRGEEKKKEKKEKKEKKNRSRKKNTADIVAPDTIDENNRDVNIVDEVSNTNTADELTEDNEGREDADDRTRDDQPYGGDNGEYDRECRDDGSDERKIFLTRIPAKFNAGSITRLFEMSFGEGCIQDISLPLTRSDVDDENDDKGGNGDRDRSRGKFPASDGKRAGVSGRSEGDEEEDGEHRGFAFVTMISISKRDEALKKDTIRGGSNETSKRKHTMYIRPLLRDGAEATNVGGDSVDVCYLWAKCRCPYGDTCKFKHVGKGACIVVDAGKDGDGKSKLKKQKCFAFQSKSGCKYGEEGIGCPYSHEIKQDKVCHVVKEKNDKDCINWKTKGKCRKKDTCPYRHDEAVLEAFLSKKRRRTENKETINSSKKRKENPQPLSVRVFGLNYDTKDSDIREYFGHCGLIKEVTFPVYEDSGRSKGYCGILFTSPKATEKACELDGKELLGRWLSVQPGKMYLKQWQEMEKVRLDQRNNGDCSKKGDNVDEDSLPPQNIGEFGQKVKKRKKHGFKD